MSAAMASLDHINKVIREVSTFIRPLLPLASCHMVNYITANHWENLLPEKIKRDLISLPKEKIQCLPSASLFVDVDQDSSSGGSDWSMASSDLASYLSAVRRHSLASLGVLTTIDKILQIHGPEEVTTLPVKGMMSEKKSHEVEVLSQVIYRLAKGCGVEWIIDLGSGKGYLSTSLVLQYALNVVAIDSSQGNTLSATTRKKRLQKYWRAIMKAEENRLLGKPVKKGKGRWRKNKVLSNRRNNVALTEVTDAPLSDSSREIGRYIPVTEFITQDTDLLQIVNNGIERETNDSKEELVVHPLRNGQDDEDKASLRRSLESKDKGPQNNCNCIKSSDAQMQNDKSENHCLEHDETQLKTDGYEKSEVENILKDGKEYEDEKAAVNFDHLTINGDSPGLGQDGSAWVNNKCRLGLVGLHTCGNLAPSSLRLFVSNSAVSFLCNVGCCYHFIEEEFSRNPFMNYEDKKQDELTEIFVPKDQLTKRSSVVDDTDDVKFIDPMHPSKIPNLSVGFPLSKTLRSEKFALGRNSRLMSCQPADRLKSMDLVNSIRALYWRSLLQVLLCHKVGDVSDLAHVGRIAAKCETFSQYARMAFTKLGFDVELKEEELREYDERYNTHLEKLERFFLLRASLAPVIEGLILLDRLAYLYENGADSAYLVQLFDPVISPRCHAIIAFKKSQV